MQRWLRIPKPLWGQLASEGFTRAVDELIDRHGGVSGVVGRMEQIGLGTVANSWTGNNVNEPIYSEQLHALFGTAVLRAMAAKLNLQPRDLVRHLSQTLPQAINRLDSAEKPTPRGLMWKSPRKKRDLLES